MKVYLIRHGQTTGDVEDRYGGAYDDELTAKGRAQTQELSGELRNSGIQIIYCSPLMRAQQTTEILRGKLGCEVKIIHDLRERNKNGILTGMTKSEAKIKYPELVEKLKNYKSQIEGAESQESFVERIKRVFLEIISNEDYSTVGIVTHGMSFWVILEDILNHNRITKISDCAYAVINKDKQGFNVERLDGVK